MNSDAGKYFIEHAGVKGMKWGVIRDDDEIARSGGGSSKSETKKVSKASSDNAMAKAVKDFYKDKDPKQLQAEGKQKQKAKAAMEFPPEKSKGLSPSKKASKDVEPDPSAEDIKKGRLSPGQKKALKIGAAVAVTGLIVYGSHRANVANKARLDSHIGEMDSLFGRGSRKPTPGDEFFTGLKSGKALDRPEFTIPKSTVFQRLSGHPETGKGYDTGAYSTFLTNDKRQYGASAEFGKKEYTVTFNAKEDIRVPSTQTVLSTLKQTMIESGGGQKIVKGEFVDIDDKDVVEAYHRISGQNWKEPQQQRLISALKKQGYSALVDDMDAGYYGDLPVVFFGEPDNVSAKPRTAMDYSRDVKEKTTVLGRYA